MTDVQHNPPSPAEREEELRQQIADQIRTSYRDLRFVADQLAADLLPIVRAATAEAQARIETLEHVARGNKRHVQLLVPEIEQLTKRAEKAEARECELEAQRDALKQRLHDAAMTTSWTNEDGKQCVFVEDLAPALLGSGPVTSASNRCPAAHGALGRICELPLGHNGMHTGDGPSGGAVWDGDAS